MERGVGGGEYFFVFLGMFVSGGSGEWPLVGRASTERDGGEASQEA